MSGRRLLLIGWHNVGPTPFFDAPAGEGERGLVRQLGWLRRVANVVPLDEGLRRLEDGSLPRRAVSLTFDDGYCDDLEISSRVVLAAGLSATFFVCPAFLDRTELPWWERVASAMRHGRAGTVVCAGLELGRSDTDSVVRSTRRLCEHLKRVRAAERDAAVAELEALTGSTTPPTVAMLDWSGARTLVRRGHTIGSHSMRHVILGNETPNDQLADLAAARIRLETELQIDVDLLAYPNGRRADFDEHTVLAARASGHRAAITTIDGRNSAATPRFELRRLVINCSDSPRVLAAAARACWRADTPRSLTADPVTPTPHEEWTLR